MDGLLAIGGCDKNMPGAMIAIARLDVPSVFVYGGTIKPGRLRRTGPDDRQRVRGGGAVERRARSPRRSSTDVERNACPGAGSCGGMYTANTMSSAIEALGLSLPGLVHGRGRGRRGRGDRRPRGARAGGGHPRRPAPARAPDARGLRERDRAGDGARRVDERGPAPARDRARGRGAARAGRLRAHPPARAGAVRPQAVRPLRRDRPPSRRRRLARDEDAALEGPARTAACAT